MISSLWELVNVRKDTFRIILSPLSFNIQRVDPCFYRCSLLAGISGGIGENFSPLSSAVSGADTEKRFHTTGTENL